MSLITITTWRSSDVGTVQQVTGQPMLRSIGRTMDGLWLKINTDSLKHTSDGPQHCRSQNKSNLFGINIQGL